MFSSLWFHPVGRSSVPTGPRQELPSATLMPLVALQRAIEEPPEELRDERCFGENRAEENVTSLTHPTSGQMDGLSTTSSTRCLRCDGSWVARHLCRLILLQTAASLQHKFRCFIGHICSDDVLRFQCQNCKTKELDQNGGFFGFTVAQCCTKDDI